MEVMIFRNSLLAVATTDEISSPQDEEEDTTKEEETCTGEAWKAQARAITLQ
jgi:hypothetical protein